jgi:hypothetical protein
MGDGSAVAASGLACAQQAASLIMDRKFLYARTYAVHVANMRVANRPGVCKNSGGWLVHGLLGYVTAVTSDTAVADVMSIHRTVTVCDLNVCKVNRPHVNVLCDSQSFISDTSSFPIRFPGRELAGSNPMPNIPHTTRHAY